MNSDSARTTQYRDLGLWTDEQIGDLIPRRAAQHPDRELFLFEGTRVTYGQFDSWVTVVASAMVARGVRKGDRVHVQLPNCLEALVLQVAAFRIGALNVPVVPIYREHETAQILDDARPAVVAVSHTLGSRNPFREVDASLSSIGHVPAVKFVVGGSVEGWDAIPAFGSSSPEVALPEPGAAHEVALVLYTSGTTSAPKGAYLSSRALIAHLKNFRDVLDLDESTVLAAGTPLSHLGGFIAGVIFPAYLGARSVILPSWKPDAAVKILETEKVTLMMGATVFLQDLVDRYRAGAAPVHRITNYTCAGAAIPPRLIRDAEKVGVNAIRCYGMTETAGICTAANSGDSVEKRSGWDGKILPGMEMQAVDEDRCVLPEGVAGEMRIRGPQLFEGYTDPQVTSAQFDNDGWFYPGDVGIVVDGWFRMTGRSKDIINRGGEKFSAQDIEQAILSHPDIVGAAVTAVPDERLGEAVGAWICLREGVIWNGATKYLDHLDVIKLAKAKFPTEWHVVSNIPTTATGKIQKFRLADTTDLAKELQTRL